MLIWTWTKRIHTSNKMFNWEENEKILKRLNNEQKNKILIMVIFFVLVTSIVIQLRTMSKQDSNVSLSFQNSELKNKLLEWEDRYSIMVDNLDKSSKELEQLRTSIAANNTNSTQKSEELKKNNMLLGLTDVTGEWIIITVQDGQAPKNKDIASEFLVHDGDLREIVSELSNAGAEAISINDQRIVSTTCINCVGNVISINGEKVNSPFVIKAIGNQASLYSLNRPGSYIKLYMEDYTPVEIKKSNNIEIKKYNGALTHKYAKTINE